MFRVLGFVGRAKSGRFDGRGWSGPARSLLNPRDRAAEKAIAGAAYAHAAVAALRGMPVVAQGACTEFDIHPSLSPRELLSLSASLLMQAREALAGPAQAWVPPNPCDGCLETPSVEAKASFEVVPGQTEDRDLWEVQIGDVKIASTPSNASANELVHALNQTIELWAQAHSPRGTPL